METCSTIRGFNLCVLLLLVVATMLLPLPTLGLSCPSCDQGSPCPYEPLRCAYGKVRDACGCCFVCGNGPGEECGGEFQMLGACGKGFECVSNHAGPKLSQFPEGQCILRHSRVQAMPRPWLRPVKPPKHDLPSDFSVLNIQHHYKTPRPRMESLIPGAPVPPKSSKVEVMPRPWLKPVKPLKYGLPPSFSVLNNAPPKTPIRPRTEEPPVTHKPSKTRKLALVIDSNN